MKRAGHSLPCNVWVSCDWNYAPPYSMRLYGQVLNQHGDKFTVLKSLSVLVCVASRRSSRDNISRSQSPLFHFVAVTYYYSAFVLLLV